MEMGLVSIVAGQHCQGLDIMLGTCMTHNPDSVQPCGKGSSYIYIHSETSLIRAVWDQGVPVSQKLPVN